MQSKFLDDLETKVKPIGVADRAELLKLKKETEGDDSVLNIWDWRFYDRLYVEKKLDLDDSLVKEYFPVDVVVPAIMKVYQEMLGVKFVQLGANVENGEVWHQGRIFFAAEAS